MIVSFAARLRAVKRWPRWVFSFMAGATATLALPPYHLIPVLWLALPVFLWLLDGCTSWRSAMRAGWAFGFGHFTFGLAWITHAFYVDAATFGLLAWPALIGLAFGMGVFFAAVAVMTHVIPPLQNTHRAAARALLFAAAWMLQEWARNWILTGFPWNPMATVWSESLTPVGLAIQQSVSVIGTFGLSLITVAAASLAACLGASAPARARLAWSVGPLLVLALIGGWGAARLNAAPTAFVPGVKFRLVQPNIPEADKQNPKRREEFLYDYVHLSTDGRPPDVNVVVWGEDAVSYIRLDQDEVARAIAAAAVPPNGLLITGGDRGDSPDRIFNSLYAIAPDGQILATYDKSHLVPFGEFMPLARYIPMPIRQFTGDFGFASGPGLRTLRIPGLPPFTPLICFEAIFPGHVVAHDSHDTRWLLNLTNDSWFGTATGPYQHFATARLRTIEEGLPLIRTANTGISAAVDSYGRVIASLGLDQRGVVDVPLPEALGAPTVFARAGNLLSLAAATIMSCAALVLYRRTR